MPSTKNVHSHCDQNPYGMAPRSRMASPLVKKLFSIVHLRTRRLRGELGALGLMELQDNAAQVEDCQAVQENAAQEVDCQAAEENAAQDDDTQAMQDSAGQVDDCQVVQDNAAQVGLPESHRG